MNCLFIYNPTSGKKRGKKNANYIENELKKHFDAVDVKPTGKAGDASEFSSEACGKYDVLVVAGGDGTLNEVINAIATKENRPRIGYIPTGTTNDLAHSLKIPKNVKRAVKIITAGKYISHDIFKVNEKYGIYVCAFGMCTGASYLTKQNKKNKFGKVAYFVEGVKELGGTKRFEISVKSDNINIEDNIVLGLIINSRYVGGFKINKMANCSDGFVNLILFKERKKRGVSIGVLFKVAKAFLFGINSIAKSKACHVLKLNKFEVTLPEDKIINIDGEMGTTGSFNFEVLKQHIQIFVKG